MKTRGNLAGSLNSETIPSPVKITPKVEGRALQASAKLIELPNDVTPKGIPAKVATTIPIRIAPFTFKITNSKVTTSPIKNTISCG